MKKFISRLALFILLPLPFLFVLNYITDKGLHKSNLPLFTEWNDIYASKANADVLINGSSRAWVHVSPKILDSALNTNSYNIGIDGWHFKMQYARFRVYMQHNKKPRLIIQSLDMTTLHNRSDLFQYQQFLPYLNDSIIWNATMGYRGHFNDFQRYFPLYKYNQNLRFIKEGVLAYLNHDRNPRVKYKGYQGQNATWSDAFEIFKKENPNGSEVEVDRSTCEDFEAYLSYCKQNNIKVVLVYSPEYYEMKPLWTNREQIFNRYRAYAKEFDIPFLDYSNDSLCFNTKYFYNSQHMNTAGSEIFSRQLAADVKQYLQN
jgi:hypothetical protein